MSTVSDGNVAEQAVAHYLQDKGYIIRATNWKNRLSEIDIIAEKQKTIYFVEVKYRRTIMAGDGFDYVTPAKLRHMERAATVWVQEQNWHGPYELLAAAVTGDQPEFFIELRNI